MKKDKHSLLIVLGITFGIFVILSYIIPLGSFSSGTLTKGVTQPVGLVGLFKTPIYSMGIFVQYFVVFIAIGVFYAVISKTGVYTKIVDNFVKKFSKNKTLFLIISIILFALLSSLTGLSMVLFLFVPFIATIFLLLGFDKVTTLVSTVGSILVGSIGSTYGTSVIFKNFLAMDSNNGILYKFILLAILVFLLIMFVLGKNKSKKIIEETVKEKSTKNSKKQTATKVEKAEDKLEIPFYTNAETSKKSLIPLIVVVILTFIIAVLGMFNWYYTFGIELFTNIYNSVIGFEVGGVAIFSKIIGSFTEFGYWGNYEFATLLLASTILIGWLYSIKAKDLIDTMADGAKKMVDPAVYVILSCIIFAVIVNGSNGNISATITNFLFGLSKTFNVLLATISGIVGAFFFNDFPYFIQNCYSLLATFETTVFPIMSIVIQAAFGLAMLILPVSVILIAGLRYLNVSYKEWIKYIWKFVIQVFVIIIIFGLILTMIIK